MNQILTIILNETPSVASSMTLSYNRCVTGQAVNENQGIILGTLFTRGRACRDATNKTDNDVEAIVYIPKGAVIPNIDSNTIHQGGTNKNESASCL